VSTANELALSCEVKTLREIISQYEVDSIMLKMRVNESDGLLQATRAHNSALFDRVQELARRVEDMTRSSSKAE
jgi:hypothetical protein